MKLKQLASAVILATSSVSAIAANYTLSTVPVNDLAYHNFAKSIGENGVMVTTTKDEYNPPIDYDLLDFDSLSFLLLFEDPSAVEQENPSTEDYHRLWEYLVDARDNGTITTQHLAEYRSYITDTIDYDGVFGFDQYKEKFDDYSKSVYTIARDAVNGDFVVGTTEGYWNEIDYEDEDDNEYTYVVNDVLRRAFVQINGQTFGLLPDDDTMGGYSDAFAINNRLQVAGYGSSWISETVEDYEDACEDEDERSDIPEAVCKYNIRNTSSTFVGLSQTRPHIWQLDSSGTVLDVDVYDLVFTPESSDDSRYVARAYGINNNGIAVGDSQTGESVVVTRPNSSAAYETQLVAVAYQDGDTVELLPRSENLISTAIDINDEGWITGYTLRDSDDTNRNKLYIYKLDTGETLLPSGFFSSSGVTPSAINNNNMVVGAADYEATTDTNREKHAFLYDMEADEFIDLNTYLSCTDQNKYELIDAVDINDSNEIIANARIRITDTYINGEDILDDSADTDEVDKIIAVKLTPTSGGIDNCDVDEEGYERQGASLSWLFPMVMLPLVFLRRRKRS